MQELSEDPDEPDWVDTFGRWRWVLDDALGEVAHPDLEGTDHLVSVLRVEPDGSRDWWMHDVARRRVCRSGEPPGMDDEHRRNIDDAIAAALLEGPDGPWTIGWIGHPGLPPDDAVWIREHEVVPSCEIMLRPTQR